MGFKAQVSVETLLVFVIFLSLLGIAIGATSTVGTQSRTAIGKSLARESFNELTSKIEDVCLLGKGNTRTVVMNGAPPTLSSSGTELTFHTIYYDQTYDSSCALIVSNGASSQVFTITNIDGTNVQLT